MSGFTLLRGFDFDNALVILLPIDAHAAEILSEDAAPAPLSPIRLSVTGWRRRAGGGDWATVPVPDKGLRLRSRATPSSHLAVFDAVEGDDGIVRQPYFGGGQRPSSTSGDGAVENEIDLKVDGEIYRPTTRPVSLPAHERLTEIRLRPNYRYPFRSHLLPNGRRWPTLVRGRLVDDEMRGVAGMLVRLETQGPEDDYETDATGHFVLVPPPDEATSTISITVFRPGEATPITTSKADVEAGELDAPITVIKLPAGSTGD